MAVVVEEGDYRLPRHFYRLQILDQMVTVVPRWRLCQLCCILRLLRLPT
jgi:hypothetical protein